MRRLYPVTFLIAALIICGSAIANDNPDFRYLEPDGMALPQGSFGLGIVIEPNYRLAFLTGRTGSNADGSYSSDFETQARNALASVGQLLEEAGMDWSDVVNWSDVVKINVYLTDAADIPVWARVRNEIIADSRPAGTGVIVKALAAPDARVEVTVIAAQKVD
jgi:enamine deaminase RidA (YjgF/YER057c/UK114 family)